MTSSKMKAQTRNSSKGAKRSSKSAKNAPVNAIRFVDDDIKAFRRSYIERLGYKPEDFDAILAFDQLKGEARVKASREVIQKSIIDKTEDPDERFPLAVKESETLLEGYATLDSQHRAEIQKLIDQITAYLGDSTRKRREF